MSFITLLTLNISVAMVWIIFTEVDDLLKTLRLSVTLNKEIHHFKKEIHSACLSLSHSEPTGTTAVESLFYHLFLSPFLIISKAHDFVKINV